MPVNASRARRAAALVVLIAGCASLPPPGERAPSRALEDTGGTLLGRMVAAAGPRAEAGIHALPDPHDAFVARMALAAVAERSLDLQYYIWHGDVSGTLLYEAALRAAERGVRVRLLLDDNNTAGLDPLLAALDAHPNIEVRLYNPFAHRGARALDFIADFDRVNRRMHNKAFIADNQAAIVGGRNVGDEYFAAGEGKVFADLDVLAVGPVVREVSGSFDRYWNSASAYPAGALLGAGSMDAATLEATFAEARARPEARGYLEALRDSALARGIAERSVRFDWVPARVLVDDPAKTLGEAPDSVLLLSGLMRAIGRPRQSFDLVSPYFVPGKAGARALTDLARGGVRVRVLTNSLAATDVAPVHAGYAKRREALLEAGVRLYELKPTADAVRVDGARRQAGHSGASLHAKTFAVDGEHLFVGSFNFDPRSARLNTELGLLIDSRELAGRLAAAFERDIPGDAYEVRLSPAGGLEWIDRPRAGPERVYDTEPGTGALQRGWVDFLEWLPIEPLL